MYLSPPGMSSNETQDTTRNPGCTEEDCTRGQEDHTTKNFAALTSIAITVYYGLLSILRMIKIPQFVAVILKETYPSATHGAVRETTESVCVPKKICEGQLLFEVEVPAEAKWQRD